MTDSARKYAVKKGDWFWIPGNGPDTEWGPLAQAHLWDAAEDARAALETRSSATYHSPYDAYEVRFRDARIVPVSLAEEESET